VVDRKTVGVQFDFLAGSRILDRDLDLLLLVNFVQIDFFIALGRDLGGKF